VVAAVETQACGNCGSRSRTCSDSCSWSSWGSCGGEGACAPDATRQNSCNDCGNQELRCSDACQWENVGNCDNSPARSCDDGNSCTQDNCSGTGFCSHPPTECCGNDVSGCGNEPLCTDWTCDNGTCSRRYEQRGTDPENECSGHKCCTGGSSCQNMQQQC